MTFKSSVKKAVQQPASTVKCKNKNTDDSMLTGLLDMYIFLKNTVNTQYQIVRCQNGTKEVLREKGTIYLYDVTELNATQSFSC